MRPEELAKNFLKARKVIAELFEETWLESGTENELQKLWERTDWTKFKADWIACTELLVFGDCLEKCNQINEDRTRYFVEKIKRSQNHNERKGAIYEIFVAGAFYNEGNSIVNFPANPESPDYDLMLIQNEFNIYLSVKNYNSFDTRVEEFAEKSKQIKEKIKQNIQRGCNTVFIINDESFPDVLAWRSLRENLPDLLNSDSKKTNSDKWMIPVVGGWSVFVKYTTGNEQDSMKNTHLPGPLCLEKASYICSIFAKLHENDLKTLFGKIFEKACENFEKIGKIDEGSVNIVFLMVPREISLETCKLRCNEYFRKRENSRVAGIFLHQPEFASMDSSCKESMTHCYELVINPSKSVIMKKLKLMPRFVAGLWNEGSAPIMFVTGKTNIKSNDTEYLNYQSGHIFYQPRKDKYNFEMVNGVLMEPCDSSAEMDKKSKIKRMLLPENDDLLLL